MGFGRCNFAGIYETFIFVFMWGLACCFYFFETEFFDLWVLYISLIAFVLRIFVVAVRYGYTNEE